MLTPGLVGKDIFTPGSSTLLAMDTKTDSGEKMKLDWQKRAKVLATQNVEAGLTGKQVRQGIESRLTTPDGKVWKLTGVTQSTKDKNLLPGITEILLDDKGKVIDTKAAKQLPIKELSDFINNPIEKGGVKWPEYVPEEARSEDAYNKWIRQRYYRGKTGTGKVQVQDGLIVPHETGHFTASSKTNIGMNPWVGAQVKYGPQGNQTTTQKYIVDKGDTIEDVASKFGVRVDQIKKANKGKVKKGILTAGEKITIQTIKSNTDDTRLIADLEALDMGGKDVRTSQFKAVEEWIGHFAPESEKGKYRVHTIDTLGGRKMGVIGHDSDFDPTASGALEKIELLDRKETQDREIRKVNPLQTPSDVDKFKADIIAKNPTLPNTIGLQPNTSSTRSFFDRVKSKLQSTSFQREAARLAGQSHIPWTNVAGDFVGVIYDGMAVAANPTDKQAIVDLFLSGTQAITSGVGAALIAVPEPTTSGLGYVIMRAGDQVGRLERLWNMQREGVALATGKIELDPNMFTKGSKTRQNLEVQQLVKGNEVAEIKNELQFDKRIKRQNLPKLNF